MDYNATFEKRGHLYKYAIETYPFVLTNEFQTTVDMCNIKSDDILLNIPAACVPLNRHFKTQPKKYIQYETNTPFAKLLCVEQCELDKIPEKSNTVDTIITLASLHHTTEAERHAFYNECNRILKPNTGKLIIGDVIKGSKQDNWLNIFVNKYNSAGHNGTFWNESDINLLHECGFEATTCIKSYSWTFESETKMIDFCKNLFGLDLASESDIKNGIETYLQPYKLDDKIHFDWSLIYFTATKLQDASPYHKNKHDYHQQV